MVPGKVMGDPPAKIVVPAMEKAEGFGVNVWPAIMKGEIAGSLDDGVGSE